MRNSLCFAFFSSSIVMPVFAVKKTAGLFDPCALHAVNPPQPIDYPKSGSSEGVAVYPKIVTINKLRPKSTTAEQLNSSPAGGPPVTGRSRFPSGCCALFPGSTAGFRITGWLCEIGFVWHLPRQAHYPFFYLHSNPLFSPDGETKCVRGPSVQGARRSARGGVLEQHVEHGEQAQRSNGGPIACFDRQLVRNVG